MNIEELLADERIGFIDSKYNVHEGFVLGTDRSGYVWAIVPKVGKVFEFNITNVEILRGEKCFYLYDRSQSIASVANGDPPGDVRAPLFVYAENAEELVQKVKAYHLLMH